MFGQAQYEATLVMTGGGAPSIQVGGQWNAPPNWQVTHNRINPGQHLDLAIGGEIIDSSQRSTTSNQMVKD
jgi:hypothetical protein